MTTGIRLISTDFDGTLVGQTSQGRCVPELARALTAFKETGGLWAINTGRSLEHIVEGVALFDAPVEPDFLMTHERELYHRDADGVWRDFGDWNRLCRERHAELFHAAAGIFARVRELVAGAHDVTLLEENGFPVGLVTADEAVMDRVASSLDALRHAVPKFHYQRNTIYLRFCHADYDKGAVLAELCRLIEMPRDQVFAVGDHFNDLAMLDGRHARHVACPANAISEVRTVVRAAEGWVARLHFGEGTAQVLMLALSEAHNKKPADVR
jgi:hydroxymethylpyrimidine pyrophosphatase-like HAD family hydrolase